MKIEYKCESYFAILCTGCDFEAPSCYSTIILLILHSTEQLNPEIYGNNKTNSLSISIDCENVTCALKMQCLYILQIVHCFACRTSLIFFTSE